MDGEKGDDPQVAVLKGMRPEERFSLMCQLNEAMLESAVSGIRYMHPEYGSKEIEWELARRIHGTPTNTS
jgi:hypothetical protein